MSEINEEKIKIVPNPVPETGIDTAKSVVDNIIEASYGGYLDASALNNITNTALNREQTYELIDSMLQDGDMSAVLETYTEDTIETNDRGQAIWVESSDSDVLNYTSWLLESLNIDKHLYSWTYCLYSYGDLYVRLFRQSDCNEGDLFKEKSSSAKRNKKLNESHDKKEPLKEGTQLVIYADDDPYVPYVEMVDNPGEMFELIQRGKSYAYIKAPTRVIQTSTDQMYNYLTHYKMKQKDVEIFDATTFVHACLENTNQRQPETVDLYVDSLKTSETDEIASTSNYSSFKVKHGQSALYNVFRIWRELNLLESSALLNRLTKSAVTRIITIDGGDMSKEKLQNYVRQLKEKIEQKSAINTNGTNASMAEYTNPGPIENTIFTTTVNGHGNITATTIGGDFDPKSLVDLDYFRSKLYGALKTPKQFFGFTDDGAGFNGGSSLSIISSRYGKTIKKTQAIICQMVTDIINLFLIDRGLDTYVNKFQVRMQAPVTQEELDRRANVDNRLRYVGDFMSQLADVENKATKLKIQKALLSNIVNDSEVIGLLQDYIDSVEKPKEEKATDNNAPTEEPIGEGGGLVPEEENELPPLSDIPAMEAVEEKPEDEKEVLTEDEVPEDDSYLPSPDELDMDMTK